MTPTPDTRRLYLDRKDLPFKPKSCERITELRCITSRGRVEVIISVELPPIDHDGKLEASVGPVTVQQT
jgi:hypothetical protein